jgi:hypothetical protein
MKANLPAILNLYNVSLQLFFQLQSHTSGGGFTGNPSEYIRPKPQESYGAFCFFRIFPPADLRIAP